MVLVDQTRLMIHDAAADNAVPNCTADTKSACKNAIIFLLNLFDSTWGTGEAINQVLLNSPELASQLDPDATFRPAWAGTESAAKIVTGQGNFPWDYSLLEAVAAAKSKLDKVIDRANQLAAMSVGPQR